MEKLEVSDITQYIEQNISAFHQRRIEGLNGLNLHKVLKRKNPYLFRTKNIQTSEQIIRSFMDAHISSQEETIFGEWLEGLALFVIKKVHTGWKSSGGGIDIEFDKDNIRYIISVKSGPNWGNSKQISELKKSFVTAKKTLRTSNSGLNVVAINGCCYGRDNKPDKGDYFKYCGQKFWEFISGDMELYLKFIKPLEYLAREKNTEFYDSYCRMINKFTLEFAKDFCLPNGSINWEKLVEFNSAIILPEIKK